MYVWVSVWVTKINDQIWKVEYLSNHWWSDHAQILKLSLCDQNQGLQMQTIKMTNHERQPKLEDNLKILLVKYLSNHWSDQAQILNLKEG